ncbi:hypothetical protein IAT38_002209 [Cryptococcus sp. DSM 104549]
MSAPHRPSLPTSTSQSGPGHRSHRGKYGTEVHLVFHEEYDEEWKPRRLRELVRPFTVRQWMEDGRIHREPSPREVPRFELFFDLLFVAIIHQLADAAIEEPGGPSVARFVLTFWPSWSLWEEARKYANQSGTDDLLHRLWICAGMISLLGYSANASAIELSPSEEEESLDHSAVRAAVAFWLIIKLTRVIVLFWYAWKLPRFRTAHIWKGFAVLIPMFLFLPLIWVTSRPAQITLAALLIVLDVCRIDLGLLFLRGKWSEYRRRRAEGQRGLGGNLHQMPVMPGLRIPATNIEHSIDRMGAFVVIVLGELVMNLVYTAGKGDIGASAKFGKASLGLVVAWSMNWLYMLPSEPNAEYEHALRWSWLSGSLWSFFHWPLCASLVLASAASGRMIAEDEVEDGVHWYWGCGLGFALLFTTLLDLTHHSLLPPNAHQRIPRGLRALFSLACSLALILFPLGAAHLSSMKVLGISLAVVGAALVVGVVGMLPRVGEKWDEGGVEEGLEGRGRVRGEGESSGESAEADGVRVGG